MKTTSTLYSILHQTITPETCVASFFLPLHNIVSLNAYIQLERSNRFAASALKKQHHAKLCSEIARQMIPPVPSGNIHIHMVWHIPNTRMDPDNIAWGKKYVLDALVGTGTIKSDTFKTISSLSDDFVVVGKDQTGVRIECFTPSQPTYEPPREAYIPASAKKLPRRKNTKDRTPPE